MMPPRRRAMSDQFNDPKVDGTNGKTVPQKVEKEPTEIGILRILREWINRLGIAKPASRIGTHVLTLGVIIITVIALGNFFIKNVESGTGSSSEEVVESGGTSGERNASPETISQGVILPEYSQPDSAFFGGIPRLAEPVTIIPSRPRVNVVPYTVVMGDNLFDIAAQFGLDPLSILWANKETLQDNPRLIKPEQVLNILPVDGVYYRYNIGESLRGIAQNHGVSPEAIIEWPGNYLDPYETDPDNPGISDGTWLIIPGGETDLVDWGPPPISRVNPAVAAYYGEGSCGEIYEGPVGTYTFIWPTPSTILSGYGYTPGIHEAIDIGGNEGDVVWATDSGVVVFAGWSQYGYGFLIVIDHGTGWQSAYAHLQGIGARCGQGVNQGDPIGSLGNTGNSSGAHLHFELQHESYGKVNPLDYVVNSP